MDKSLLLIGIGSAFLLNSCVVYMPMQCAAPQITDKKQGEVTASSYLNGRYDLAANYSPVQHLLVRAAYSSLRDNSQDSTYYRGNQYELGLGSYWQLSEHWLVGGLGGFGQAKTGAAYTKGGIFARPEQYLFDVRYAKIFGEAYGTFQASDAVSFGAAYRVTRVNFTTLTNLGAPIDLSGMTRSEPMFFFRVRPGNGPTDSRPVQVQFALGLSDTFGYNPRNRNATYPDGVTDLKQGRSYTTLSISIFPQCLFQKPFPGKDGR